MAPWLTRKEHNGAMTFTFRFYWRSDVGRHWHNWCRWVSESLPGSLEGGTGLAWELPSLCLRLYDCWIPFDFNLFRSLRQRRLNIFFWFGFLDKKYVAKLQIILHWYLNHFEKSVPMTFNAMDLPWDYPVDPLSEEFLTIPRKPVEGDDASWSWPQVAGNLFHLT